MGSAQTATVELRTDTFVGAVEVSCWSREEDWAVAARARKQLRQSGELPAEACTLRVVERRDV